MPTLSIVVPCFNEEACIPELYRRLTAAATAAVGDDYELVLVNDGSGDGTWPAMFAPVEFRVDEDDSTLAVDHVRRSVGEFGLLL